MRKSLSRAYKKLNANFEHLSAAIGKINSKFENITHFLQSVGSLAIIITVISFLFDMSDRDEARNLRREAKIRDAKSRLGIDGQRHDVRDALNLLFHETYSVRGANIQKKKWLFIDAERGLLECARAESSYLILGGREFALGLSSASEIELNVLTDREGDSSNAELKLRSNFMPRSWIRLQRDIRPDWEKNDLTGATINFEVSLAEKEIQWIRNNLIDGTRFYFKNDEDMRVGALKILSRNCVSSSENNPWFEVLAEGETISDQRNFQDFQDFNDGLAKNIQVCTRTPKTPKSRSIDIPMPSAASENECSIGDPTTFYFPS